MFLVPLFGCCCGGFVWVGFRGVVFWVVFCFGLVFGGYFFVLDLRLGLGLGGV
jgi:hypothetical protein